MDVIGFSDSRGRKDARECQIVWNIEMNQRNTHFNRGGVTCCQSRTMKWK